jgi:hypothetical protein
MSGLLLAKEGARQGPREWSFLPSLIYEKGPWISGGKSEEEETRVAPSVPVHRIRASEGAMCVPIAGGYI